MNPPSMKNAMLPSNDMHIASASDCLDNTWDAIIGTHSAKAGLSSGAPFRDACHQKPLILMPLLSDAEGHIG